MLRENKLVKRYIYYYNKGQYFFLKYISNFHHKLLLLKSFVFMLVMAKNRLFIRNNSSVDKMTAE